MATKTVRVAAPSAQTNPDGPPPGYWRCDYPSQQFIVGMLEGGHVTYPDTTVLSSPWFEGLSEALRQDVRANVEEMLAFRARRA